MIIHLSNLKATLRTLWKQKGYTILNICGLSSGLAAAILLFLIVRYEKSFDSFHPQVEDIYKLGESFETVGEAKEYYVTRTPVIPNLLEEYPQVVSGTRSFEGWHWIGVNDKIQGSLVHYVDSGFTDVFSFSVIQGDPHQALSKPDHIVLTKSLAQKLFPKGEALGKTVELDKGEARLVVGAVLEDPPKTSSLQFEALLSWFHIPEFVKANGTWYNTFMTSYIKLQPGTDPEELEEELVAFSGKYFDRVDGQDNHLILLAMSQVRSVETKNTSLMTLLGSIAALILVIACINFTNLSTAQSFARTREISIRKVLGASRKQIISQFLMESLIISFVSLVIGIFMVELALGPVNEYFDLGISLDLLYSPEIMVILLVIGIGTGLASGIYPALFLSRFKPFPLLKGGIKATPKGKFLQKGLIVLQYTCSMLLIGGTLVIWKQIDFMKTSDLRFNQENLVATRLYPQLFENPQKAAERFKTLKVELEREPAILSTSFSSMVPGRYNENYNSFFPSDDPSREAISLRQNWVDEAYFDNYGINLIEGRFLDPNLATDTTVVVINQAAKKVFAWQDINNKFVFAGSRTSNEKYRVVGVVEDYHYQTLKREIQPLIHFNTGKDIQYGGILTLRLAPGKISEGLQVLEETYQSLDPLGDFDYYFIDEQFSKMYKEQERLGVTASSFSVIAIIIATLGLFGLAAYTTYQRRKEVSIRKVFGASVRNIVILLSQNFALLVGFAFLIAVPIIYVVSEIFLQDFAYRIVLTPGIFIFTGISALVIATLSVSYQAIKVAIDNPVNWLREE